MTVYCSWGKLVPFVVESTMLLSDLFTMMAKKAAPGVTPEDYCLVRSNDIKKPLPLNKTLSELNIIPETQFVCKHDNNSIDNH